MRGVNEEREEGTGQPPGVSEHSDSDEHEALDDKPVASLDASLEPDEHDHGSRLKLWRHRYVAASISALAPSITPLTPVVLSTFSSADTIATFTAVSTSPPISTTVIAPLFAFAVSCACGEREGDGDCAPK